MEEHLHPCIDCGTMVGRRRIRCRACFANSRRGEKSPKWKGGAKAARDRFWTKSLHPCEDCGQLGTAYAKRCHSCATKISCKTYPRVLNAKHRYQTPYGYIMLKKLEYHRTTQDGLVFEHIFIWEEAHKQHLPKGWIIHHLNGIKNDNRIINLVALPNRKHIHILQAKAKRIQELEALLNNQLQIN